MDPKQLPFEIEDEIGTIVLADEPYLGVYHVAAKKDKTKFFNTEYYLGQMMKSLGVDGERKKSDKNMLTVTPEADTNFVCW